MIRKHSHSLLWIGSTTIRCYEWCILLFAFGMRCKWCAEQRGPSCETSNICTISLGARFTCCRFRKKDSSWWTSKSTVMLSCFILYTIRLIFLCSQQTRDLKSDKPFSAYGISAIIFRCLHLNFILDLFICKIKTTKYSKFHWYQIQWHHFMEYSLWSHLFRYAKSGLTSTVPTEYD